MSHYRGIESQCTQAASSARLNLISVEAADRHLAVPLVELRLHQLVHDVLGAARVAGEVHRAVVVADLLLVEVALARRRRRGARRLRLTSRGGGVARLLTALVVVVVAVVSVAAVGVGVVRLLAARPRLGLLDAAARSRLRELRFARERWRRARPPSSRSTPPPRGSYTSSRPRTA